MREREEDAEDDDDEGDPREEDGWLVLVAGPVDVLSGGRRPCCRQREQQRAEAEKQTGTSALLGVHQATEDQSPPEQVRSQAVALYNSNVTICCYHPTSHR